MYTKRSQQTGCDAIYISCHADLSRWASVKPFLRESRWRPYTTGSNPRIILSHTNLWNVALDWWLKQWWSCFLAHIYSLGQRSVHLINNRRTGFGRKITCIHLLVNSIHCRHYTNVSAIFIAPCFCPQIYLDNTGLTCVNIHNYEILQGCFRL